MHKGNNPPKIEAYEYQNNVGLGVKAYAIISLSPSSIRPTAPDRVVLVLLLHLHGGLLHTDRAVTEEVEQGFSLPPPSLVHRPVKDRFRPGGWSVGGQARSVDKWEGGTLWFFQKIHFVLIRAYSWHEVMKIPG